MEYKKKSVGEIVREQESAFTSGTVQISKYVTHSLSETLEQIEAYSNSTHLTGEKDSLGREKPFEDIGTASMNVTYRATDIDRSHIRIRGTSSKQYVNSFLATILLQDWMKRQNFGSFLNEWGRTLAKYGSAMIKFVNNADGLHIEVVPWRTLIVDAVDADKAPKIEILELTEAELRERVTTHGYDEEQVEALCQALTARETQNKQKKDNKNDFIRLYEVHGKLPLSCLNEEEEGFAQQMHVISYVPIKNGRKTEYKDFTLVAGREERDPYMLTHLIKEDGRTLAKGAFERMFQAQWMVNHAQKSVKDALDASKKIFQTSDDTFAARNFLTDLQAGDIVYTKPNSPLMAVDTSALDITSWQNFAAQWKQAGREINSVSEAMLGAAPKSGQAWRQTEAVLQESYSLFELMTENKDLQLEEMLRTRIIPELKKSLNTSDEVAAILSANDVERLDRMFITAEAIRKTNEDLLEYMKKEDFDPEELANMQTQKMTEYQGQLKETLGQMAGQRFIKPSELSDKTWAEQLKDLEWNVDIDITGEQKNVQEMLTTLNTALQIMVTPGFDQNPRAKAVVGRILELSGALSPVEYNALPEPVAPMQPPTGTDVGVEQLQTQRNIK